MKRILSVLLSVILLLTTVTNVYASESTIQSGSHVSTNSASSTVTWINPNYNELLLGSRAYGDDGLEIMFAKAGISRSGSSVVITARTTTNISARKIGGTVYLQKLVDNQWVTCYSYSFFETDSTLASTTRSVSVETGTSYRVRVRHEARSEYTAKVVTNTSEAIAVN